MMFLFHMFLEMTDKFQRMEVNDCENTSFVQSETRTKVLHNVNLYMFELEKKKKKIVVHYSRWWILNLAANPQ